MQFVNSGVLGHILGRLAVGATYQYNTGQPISLSSPVLSASLGSGSPMRPTLVPGAKHHADGSQSKDGRGVQLQPSGIYGDRDVCLRECPPVPVECAESTPHGPRRDFSRRRININERMYLTLRFEALNALNNVVFGGPDTGVTDTNFGYNPHVQSNNPRIGQVSARFTF